MLQHLQTIYRLGVKELISLRSDPLMLFLIAYFFTFAVYSPAKEAPMELRGASMAVVDEDRSQLSQRISAALLPPFFLPPGTLAANQIDAAMDGGRYSFVLDIPPNLEADVLAGRQPAIQLNVDATAMVQAGHGAAYVQNVIAHELATFVERGRPRATEPVRLVVRSKFNPNLEAGWFLGVSQMINNISLVAILLTGAALIREREQGTVEHLLVMPLRPTEILLAKVWASGLVIVVAALLCVRIVLQWALEIPITGSIGLFVFGTVLYLFSMSAIGIFLATIARSMPQFGLLAIPLFIIINMLSGGNTPLESMPPALQAIMQASPSTHFVSFAQAILFRDASLAIVWRELVGFTLIGAAFFAGALLRFRETITVARS
jgi:ABC-2 type transport system permease protein